VGLRYWSAGSLRPIPPVYAIAAAFVGRAAGAGASNGPSGIELSLAHLYDQPVGMRRTQFVATPIFLASAC